jgi:hypothetical protein
VLSHHRLAVRRERAAYKLALDRNVYDIARARAAAQKRLTDRYPRVRLAAAIAYIRLAGDPREALPPIAEAVAAGQVREKTLSALLSLGHDEQKAYFEGVEAQYAPVLKSLAATPLVRRSGEGPRLLHLLDPAPRKAPHLLKSDLEQLAHAGRLADARGEDLQAALLERVYSFEVRRSIAEYLAGQPGTADWLERIQGYPRDPTYAARSEFEQLLAIMREPPVPAVPEASASHLPRATVGP